MPFQSSFSQVWVVTKGFEDNDTFPYKILDSEILQNRLVKDIRLQLQRGTEPL